MNRSLSRDHFKKLEFKEVEPEPSFEIEPGLKQFLNDVTLSAGITEDETDFLKRLRTDGKHPSPLFYYRELQNLRDPVNFLPVSIGDLKPERLASQIRPRGGGKKTQRRHKRLSTTSRKG